ncbi:MAG: hypothetical protein ACW9XA_09050 [Candidatus Nitrosopumilus sp. bin_6a]
MPDNTIICQKCGHYEVSGEIPDPDDWECSLCSPRKDGVIRPLLSVTVCGKCQQTYDSKLDCPNCGPETHTRTYRMGKIGEYPESSIQEHAKDAVEQGETILRNRVRDAIEEKARREKNIEALLVEQNNLLKKLTQTKRAVRQR